MTTETKLDVKTAEAAAKPAAPPVEAKPKPILQAVPSSAPQKPAPAKPAAVPQLPKTDVSVQKAIKQAKRQRRRAVLLSLFVMVILPTLLASIYFFFIASDQFVAEARFAVRGQEKGGAADVLGFLTGGGGGSTTADSYILQDFIGSREMVERIAKDVDLRAIYAPGKGDFLATFAKDEPVERFVDYWKKMVTAQFDHYSGIMAVQVRAFTPQDSIAIAQAVVKESRDLVNRISEQARNDTVVFAQKQVGIMEARLKKAREALAQFRTTEETIDPSATAAAHQELMLGLDKELLTAQSEMAQLDKFVGPDAPSRQFLQSKIDILKSQIAERRKRFGISDGAAGTATPSEGISKQLSTYQALMTEEEFAQKAYVSALSSLEISRAEAGRDQRYLATFVEPSLPQDAVLPRRLVNSLLFLFGTMIFWGISALLFAAVRDHMV
ncbi:hypothetical protein [Oryzibacter oryziterrae]|uniref:hypothetical protein n=1 Tax=Oryzibacter oryziterrae TaxID=2766474 RepID=UPI001F329F21|nr:hypothetical protein [Oryzibacter oryziterrae]